MKPALKGILKDAVKKSRKNHIEESENARREVKQDLQDEAKNNQDKATNSQDNKQ